MGFGLSVIGEILEKNADAEELEHFLVIKRNEMEEEYKEIRQKLRLILRYFIMILSGNNFRPFIGLLKILK